MKTEPGGGTTDYAGKKMKNSWLVVAIYYEALRQKKYCCYLKESSVLPMMYMPDALQSILDLMSSKTAKSGICYNLTAFSFTPTDITNSIKKYIPDFQVEYKIDEMRQRIADSWPDTIDDSEARKDWNWNHRYSIDSMTQDMLAKLKVKLNIQ